MGALEDTLKKVEEFADRAHGGQLRKYGSQRYIVHPVRVMEICRKYSSRLPVLASALLHDVLEDTPVTKKELQEFLESVMNGTDAKRTLDLVVELTDVYVKKDYPHLNRRRRKALEQERMEKTSADAQTVKYADILDNCAEIVKHDPDFGRVFVYECRQLLSKMKKGDERLYRLAWDMVNSNVEALKTLKKGETDGSKP